MSRPGTTITRSESRPPRSARTDIGPWFIAGETGTADAGGGVRKSIKTLTDYASRFGTRDQHVANGDVLMFDSVEFHFKEDGSEIFVSPTADATDPALTAALALLTKDLGPGQVSAPGRTANAQHIILGAHARDTNRVAICDDGDTNDVAALTPGAIAPDVARVTSLFAPWITVPGVVAGPTRTIPPSPVVAGLMAKNDAQGVTPNQPSAGLLGESQTAIDTTQSFSDVDRQTLNVNGVNVLRGVYGGVRVYGYRTLADPGDATESNYLELSNARLYMKVQAEADAVAERFVFRQIDGQRLTINEYGGALTGVLLPFWSRGSFYGATPEEAFRVDVGPNVNTDATIADQQLRANIALRMSPFAEEVVIEIVKTRITEAV